MYYLKVNFVLSNEHCWFIFKNVYYTHVWKMDSKWKFANRWIWGYIEISWNFVKCIKILKFSKACQKQLEEKNQSLFLGHAIFLSFQKFCEQFTTWSYPKYIRQCWGAHSKDCVCWPHPPLTNNASKPFDAYSRFWLLNPVESHEYILVHWLA